MSKYINFTKEQKQQAHNTDIYGYLLNRRKIDVDVLNVFVHKKLIYESAEYHNAVFVGRDNDGMARHIHKRSTYSDSAYKGNASGSINVYRVECFSLASANTRSIVSFRFSYNSLYCGV